MDAAFHRISAGYTNTYLLPCGDGWVLVDTGMRGRSRGFLRRCARLGVRPESIRLIIITHNHFDHVGNLKALRDRTGAPVMAHGLDAGLIEQGTVHYPRGTNVLSNAISSLGNRCFTWWGRFEACPVEIKIDRETRLESFGFAGSAVPAPGHTAGSLCVRLDRGPAFVGDCLANFPFAWRVYPPFADDPAELMRTWKMLLGWDSPLYYPAHGSPVTRERLEREYTRMTARS